MFDREAIEVLLTRVPWRIALLVTAISIVHFALAGTYREKYGTMAYRYLFYHLMIPYPVTWYARFFHPRFVA